MNRLDATRSRATRMRVVLLLLLVPLAAAVTWQAVRFTPRFVRDIAFSADGRQLLVSLTRSNDQGRIESSSVVQTWDVESWQLIRSQNIGQGTVRFSPNAEHYVVVSRAGQIRLLDPRKADLLHQWTLSTEFGAIFDVIANEQLALVRTFTQENTHSIICLDATGARTLATEDFAKFTLSGDGARLFVNRFDSPAGTWITDVYQLDGATLHKLDLTFGGFVLSGDASGDMVFRMGARTGSVLDLRTQASLPVIAPPGRDGPDVTFFSRDGRHFHALFSGGLLNSYNVRNGAESSHLQLDQPDDAFRGHVVSADQRMLAGVSQQLRQVRVWDLNTGALVATLPENPRGYAYLAACLFAGFLWCLLWVFYGVRQSPTHPWLDVLFVNAVLLACLLPHVATSPHKSIHGVMVAAILALLQALTAVTCVWWIHGKPRWTLRLIGFITGITIVVALLLGSGHRQNPGIWNVILGTTFYVAALSLLLRCWRWRGVTIIDSAVEPRSEPRDKTPWQIPLRDLLLATASIAAFLAVVRFARVFPMSVSELAYIAACGLVVATTSFAAIWAALSRQPWFLRLDLLCLAAAAGGFTPELLRMFLYPRHRFDWWAGMVCASVAVTVLLMFTILRMHGYQLSHGKRNSGLGD